jgi:hypothetical protein
MTFFELFPYKLQIKGNIELLTDKYVEVRGYDTNRGVTRSLSIELILPSYELSEHMK